MYKITTGDPTYKYNDQRKVLNILVVDDEDASRDSLRDLLKLRGHNVRTVDEGMKCVNRCSEETFDIIFMDYHINDLDGEVCGTDITVMVKDCFELTSNTSVYAYTGDSSTSAIENFKKNGLHGALIKPISAQLLNEFMDVFERYGNDKIKLKKIAIKNKNFMCLLK